MKPLLVEDAQAQSHPSLSAINQNTRRRTAEINVGALLRENAELREALAAMHALRDMAYRDPLTGLGNRRCFDDRMAEELRRARRDPDSPFSLVIVDLNNMKLINDRHGHEAGDRVLRWVAQFLDHNLRAYDGAFRLGGDEFALLLSRTRSDDAACLIARLRRELAAANASRDIPVGLSFGCSTYIEEDTSDLAIFVRADEAMYEDKRRQRQAA